MKLFVATFCAKKKLNREPKNVNYLHLKIPPAAWSVNNQLYNPSIFLYSDFTLKATLTTTTKTNGLKNKNNINVPAGQGDELNCKKTTFYHLYITILFCQHIKSSLRTNIHISSLYLYWATHMFWNICDDYYIQFSFHYTN